MGIIRFYLQNSIVFFAVIVSRELIVQAFSSLS